MTFRFRTILLPLLFVFACFASLASAQPQPQLSARRSARITAKVDRKVMRTLRGTHPEVLARATIGQRLSANTQLQHMVLVLKPSEEQENALTSLLDAQQDRNSGSFRKWLTPDTFATGFGVAPSDIAQVSAWLSDSGLLVESVSRSGRFITFSGTVNALETAFNTEMHNVTVDGEAHISNTTDIAIPAALSPVVKGLARLNNFFPKSGVVDWKKVSMSTSANGVSPDYGVDPAGTHYIGAADMATIYNSKPLTNAGVDGKGITISVIARSNIHIADVQTYRSLFGLPQNDPEIIVVGQDPGQNSDDIEAYLDAEMAGSLASGANVKFIVSSASLVGEGIDTASLYAVDNNIGDIITMSYGGCEGNNGASATAFWNDLWEEAAAQGQTVFVSSGDSGAAGCASSSATSAGTTGYGVNALGSSNFNVAVGGSMFVDYGPTAYWQNGGTNMVPNGTALGYIPEAALNQSRLTTTLLNSSATGTMAGTGVFAGGGGISIFTARPSWQTGSGISATSDPAASSGTGIAVGSPITGPHRLVPDVSFISANGHDGTLFCAEGICAQNAAGQLTNAGIVGGTSVAAPAMASAQALIDAANGGRQGNANYFYYALANQQYTTSTTACTAPNGTVASPTVTLPASTCNFHDIVAGSIIVPTATSGTAGIGFNADNGYDAATGLGSMNIANVAANWSSVNFHSTTTTLSLSPTTGNHGDTMIGAIQVTSGSGTPTGDVSVIASLETATGTPQVFTLTAGSVNAIVNSLPAGTYNVHAHYGGDGVFAPSDSAPVSVNITKEASSVLSFQPYQVTSAGAVNAISSMVYGSGEFYLDTEYGSASGNGKPSGTVTYTILRNGTPMPSLTAKLDTYGTAYILAGPPFASFFLVPNYPTLPGGTYSITANYSGDSNFTSNSATLGFTVTQLTPTVSYLATADATSGSPVVLNFSVTNTPTAAQGATGTVTFTDTTTSSSLGTVTMVNGKATLTTTDLTTAGLHSISAVYSGDSNYSGATPAAVTVTVTSTTSTTTVLTTTTGSPTVGAAVALSAAVTPINLGTASTVFFYDAGVLLGSGPASITTGIATLSVANFTGGVHNLTAVYGGNATHLTSTGALALTVARNGTTMSIGGAQTAVYGQTVSYNGTLTRAVGTSTTVPAVAITGVVNFYEGSTSGTLLGSAVPLFGSTSGYARFTAAVDIPNLSAGTHQIVASYPGDASYGPSTSGVATLVISEANQTITIIGVPATANFGSSGPYAVTATSTSGLPVTLSVSGPATLSGGILTLTGAGTVTVTGTQAGNGNYNSATASQTIVVGTLQMTATGVISGNSTTGYSVLVTVKNTGTGTASNVQLTTATLGATSGSGLPAALGSIPGGGSASVSVSFPGSTGPDGAGVVEKLAGTFTGGTFTGSFRAQLP